MRVTLLGTGSADGWPNPFCTCASCTAARTAGDLRSQTAVLVDGVLLLDAGADAPRQAARLGLDLRDLRAVVVTHGHPDHLSPALLLWRSWARGAAPLTVYAPPGALDLCRPWLAPATDVELEPLRAGDVVAVATPRGRYQVRAFAAAHTAPGRPADDMAAEAVVLEVTAPDGARLLYATDTGPLPDSTLEALRGARADLVLLEETFGDVVDHGTGHHDLETFPRTLAALRTAGVVHAGTRVAPVHLSHHNPPAPVLAARLAPWGAELLPDLAVLDVGPAVPGTPVPLRAPCPQRTLVTGGARSGKSRLAESLLADLDDVTYVATGGSRGDDAEWLARVTAHQARRPAAWRTVETLDVAKVVEGAPAGEAVLVDCLTLWVTGLMDARGAWESADPAAALAALDAEADRLVRALRTTRARVVVVTNEVGQGVVPATASGRLFRDAMGTVNARVAAACDEALLVVAGHPVTLGPQGPTTPGTGAPR